MSRVETFLASGEIVTPDFPSPFYCRGLARFESFLQTEKGGSFFFFFFFFFFSCLGVIWYMFNIWIVF